MTSSTSVEPAPCTTSRRPPDLGPGAAVCCLLLALASPGAVAETDQDAGASPPPSIPHAAPAASVPPGDGQPRSTVEPAGQREDASTRQDGSRRWIDAVRAQRQAMQQQLRAEHDARRRIVDPVGSARQEAHDQAFQRRRREMRERIAEDRKLFLNSGPWQTPWPQPPEFAPGARPPGISRGAEGTAGRPASPPASTLEQPGGEPPEWDNGWYYRGW